MKVNTNLNWSHLPKIVINGSKKRKCLSSHVTNLSSGFLVFSNRALNDISDFEFDVRVVETATTTWYDDFCVTEANGYFHCGPILISRQKLDSFIMIIFEKIFDIYIHILFLFYILKSNQIKNSHKYLNLIMIFIFLKRLYHYMT